MFADDEIHDLI